MFETLTDLVNLPKGAKHLLNKPRIDLLEPLADSHGLCHTLVTSKVAQIYHHTRSPIEEDLVSAEGYNFTLLLFFGVDSIC